MRHSAVLIVAAALSAAVSLPGPVGAGHGCNGNVSEVGPVYLDDRDTPPFIYVESNGVAGLQSGGTNLLGFTDPCTHANPDTYVY